MNLKKLTTLLFAGVTAATPFATNAQNPTILQGNYISNVFGQANFVKNPNAQTNTANVTKTTATATRSTTTPLVATTEWNVTITSANGTVAWDTRSFDAGMKNQNCEARFTYRGFQATSKAQVKQGSNVVAELVLTPSATDPRIASINFPCGDLSSATTFVITDTAILSGTHEIGGIYVGLATNMANVAQAENVVQVGKSNTQPFTSGVEGTLLFDVETKDVYNEYDPSTGIFTAKRAGDYLVTSSVLSDSYPWSAGQYSQLNISKNNQSTCRNFYQVAAPLTINVSNFVACTITLSVGETIRTKWQQNRGTTNNLGGVTYTYMMISRFPSSSELVVTPETQNVWGGVRYYGSGFGPSYFSGSSTPTSYTTINDPGWTSRRTLIGKCKPNIANDDVGCQIENMPVGNYKVTLSGLMYGVITTMNNYVVCNYRILETTTSTSVASRTEKTTRVYASVDGEFSASTMHGVFNNTSIGNRNFTVQLRKSSDSDASNLGKCSLFTGNTSGGDDTTVNFTIEPLDNNANSALYVQGPVKAAATGTAIPSGYVGEVLYADDGGNVNTVSATYNSLSLALTPGVWDVQGKCTYKRNGATITSANWIAAITNQNNNPADSMLTWFSGANFTNVEAIAAPTEMTRVYWDGTTNITTGSFSNTSSNLVYIRCYPGSFTGGTVTVWRKIWARRVN